MRGLANYVIRGRPQALLVAVICAGVPLLFWLSAMVIGLVTLRQGMAEGAIILFWALLPASVMAWFGEVVPLAVLISMVLMAGVLRVTASWQLVLLGAGALGLLFSGLLLTVGHEYIAGIEALFADFFDRLIANSDGVAATLEAPDATDISGMFGLVLMVTLVNCLLLSRWSQAILENPGGLRRELHALRIELLPTLTLLALSAALMFLAQDFGVWAWLPLMPLLFAGLALVHGLVAARGLGVQWLVLAYMGLLLLPPVKQGLILLAAADSWLNFRSRLPVRS